ncbi:MAG TPA: FAD-binding oxidoreductase [Steroidobacteraceae bacterium]|nr:FAD-binding oxidoreductase [Steroidobacteraceae bacterium]
MRRRQLLKGALALSILPAIYALPARAGSDAFRRVRPGDPRWPAPAEWDALRQHVEGHLLVPPPLLAECERAPDAAVCQATLRHLRNPYYLGDQPSGTQVSGWFGAWTPAASAYAVTCHSSSDVVAAVNFAREHRLRLVIKGGGHSYQGTSNAADSLLVFTRPMRRIALHERFVGTGCDGIVRPCPAVTVEAGAMWMDVYDAVTTQAGRYVQGGGCATVGVAGLVQSGGFGSFSKRYGTAAGGLLEAEVVTADGVLRTVNARTDPDLYWALKGGGGGSFGAVTKLTLRTHGLPAFFGSAECTIKAATDGAFRRLVDRFVDFYAESLCNPHWGESVSIRGDNSLKVGMVSQGLSSAEAMQVWQPFFDWLADDPQEFVLSEDKSIGSRPAREWWDAQGRRQRGSTSVTFDDRPDASPTHAWWSGDQEQVGAFLHGYDSLWLPASLLKRPQRARLADALVAASRHADVGLHFNKGLAGAPAEAIAAARDTAMNASALSSFALAIVATGEAPRYPGLPGLAPTDALARRNAQAVEQATEELRAVAPAAGSYVSESNFFNRTWQRAFWGSHYARLLAVKKRYDPEGLFFVHHGVGSEDWSADGFARDGKA